MYHPEYAWMFINWYSVNWWRNNASSCSSEAKKLEEVLETSIILDHYPRIEDDHKDKRNIGNIVSISNLIIHRIIKSRLMAMSCEAKNYSRMYDHDRELFIQTFKSNRMLMQ